MKRYLKLIFLTLTIYMLGYFSVAVAGPDQSGLKFSHKTHVKANEIDCETCHATAATSTRGNDNLMPSMETCSACHDVESEDGCALCHTDVNNPGTATRVENYSVIFSHQAHLQSGLECVSCHRAVSEKEQVEPYVLPPMADCMNCHEKKDVSNTCNSCHTPSESLKPLNHGLDFLHTHGDLARLPQREAQTDLNCNLCHQVSYCESCHEGDNLDRQTHPLNYEFTHSLDARGKEFNCVVCHEDRSFCNDCHSNYRIMPQNHTAGWANRIPGDGGRHSVEARTDLDNCMACHEQNYQQVCANCHSK